MTTFKNYEDAYKTTNYTATYVNPNKKGLAPRFEIWEDGEKVVARVSTYEQAITACDQRQANYGKKQAAVETKTEAPKIEEAKTEVAPKGEDAITERQLVFIQQLMNEGKHLEGGFFHASDPTKLTKKEASLFIKSMLGDY